MRFVVRATLEGQGRVEKKPSYEDAELVGGQWTDNQLSEGIWFTAKEREIEPRQ